MTNRAFFGEIMDDAKVSAEGARAVHKSRSTSSCHKRLPESCRRGRRKSAAALGVRCSLSGRRWRGAFGLGSPRYSAWLQTGWEPLLPVRTPYRHRREGRTTHRPAAGDFVYRAEGGECVERDYSAAPAGTGAQSILIEGRSYAVQLLGEGEVAVNGRVFQVEVFDPRGPRGRRSPGGDSGPQSVTTLMPGRVVRVLVTPGQEVAAGQPVIVVEAMKMQNEMKAPRAGRVASVKAEAGATVSAGDILVVIE